jgi:uncharacterized protein YhaN
VKITALEVDGYGVWSGLKLDDLSDGVNVMFGPNEAGKTTLMQFVRSILYGFSPDRRRYLPPLAGGRAGGSVYLAGPNGRFQVSRHENADQPNGSELVELTGADGTRQGEHLLKVLLCDIDEKTFGNVFTVGLHELQHLGTLGDTEAAAMLYNLSAGMDRVPLVEVIEGLDGSRNHILHQDGQPCEVTKLIARREEIRRQLEEVGTSSRSYSRLASQRDQLSREIAGLEENDNRLKHQLRVTEIALAVRQRWQERASLDDQLKALGPVEAVSEGAIDRLNEIDDRIGRRGRQADELKRHWEEFRGEAMELEINQALWRLAPRIEVLEEQQEWIGTLHTRISELTQETGQLEEQLSAGHKEYGLDRLATEDGLPRVSSQLLARLRPLARDVRQSRQVLVESEAQAAAADDLAQSLSDRLSAALAARREPDLNQAMDRASNLVEQLRRHRQIDTRLEEMEAYRTELEQQTRGLLDRQMLPTWGVAGLGAMCMAGVAMIGLALFDLVGWPFALLGMVMAAAAVPVKMIYERSAARRLSTCQKQVRMLQSQIEQATEERQVLDEQLPSGEGTIANRLKIAEGDLAALEELVPLDSEQETARRDHQRAVELVEQAERDLATAGGAWRQALAKAGLPQSLSPRQIRDFAARNSEVAEIQRRLELRREELQQRNRELEAFNTRVARLADDVGIDMVKDDPIRQIKLLSDHLAVQESRQKRREVLRGECRQLRRKRAKCEEAVRKLKLRRRNLLGSVGADDENEFRRRAEIHHQAQSLRHDRENIQREIDAAVAGYCSSELLAEELKADSVENLPKRHEQLQKSLQAGDRRLREQIEKRGRLSEQIETLADDRSAADKRLELGIADKQLKDAIHRWQVRAVTSKMLEGIKATYEKDRQPETLQEASGYLHKLTGGRYSRVWTPLGEDVLLIDDSRGTSLAVGNLSRGTREQLFVSLRLALVSSFARRGAVMPIILDDVLVNFDAARAKATAAVLRDFAAAGHQLFVFTCHEHIVKLFKSLRVQVTRLPDNAAHFDESTVVREPAKPRPKRKPKKRPKDTPKELVARVEPEKKQPVVEAVPEEPPVEEPETIEAETPWEEQPEVEDQDELPTPEDQLEQLDDQDEDEYEEINEELLHDSDEPDDEPDEDEDEDEEASRSSDGSDEWDDEYEDEYDEAEDELDDDYEDDEYDDEVHDEDEAEDEYDEDEEEYDEDVSEDDEYDNLEEAA